MLKFLLWCLLFVLCWPLALLALVLYPIVWLLLLPFRVVGIAVGGALELVAVEQIWASRVALSNSGIGCRRQLSSDSAHTPE